MEKLTTTPRSQEIIVNNGATEGAVDVFSYAPEDTPSRALGSLYVVGHRSDESSTMGYMVSLIAALARREYYAQPSTPPKEAFSRTLRKVNEVVDEFFKNSDSKLSVGVVAVTGGQILVSKLDKFKIFLAREDKVIDILNNVMLFTKEHSTHQRFSNIIHGSLQAGDRILAFIPTRSTTTRERSVKNWFLQLSQDDFAKRVADIGTQHATFATAMLHIDIAQISEPALPTSPASEYTHQPHHDASKNPPVIQSEANASITPSLAWAPRQQNPATSMTIAAQAPHHHEATVSDLEVPNIIASEFSLSTRRTGFTRLLSRLSFVRLDQRGKAILFVGCAAFVITALLLAKSALVSSPQEEFARAAISEARTMYDTALSLSRADDAPQARSLLSRAVSQLIALRDAPKDASNLSATILNALNDVDGAQVSNPTLRFAPQAGADHVILSAWSSTSRQLFVSGFNDQEGAWIAVVDADGVLSRRVTVDAIHPDRMIPWRDSVVLIHFDTKTITRKLGDTFASFVVPTSERIIDATEFGESIYLLTESSILKVSDLDTEKVVSKRWLDADAQLAPQAQRIAVNGSIYTLSSDGTLTTYYKGRKSASLVLPILPTGIWNLFVGPQSSLALAINDTRRIYIVRPDDGSIAATLAMDSVIPFQSTSLGDGETFLMTTQEGKLWQLQQ